jgi:light-regulated signal transduction histidine kinase (bacteriophytochrome)
MSEPSRPAQLAASPHVADESCYIRLNHDSLHELAAPVNQLRPLMDLIQRKCQSQGDADCEALFGFLASASDRLEHLVSALRNHVRIVAHSEPFRYFDCTEIITSALSAMRETLNESTALVTHDSLPLVYGDPNQLRHVFRALIENSCKFHGENETHIHIAATTEENGWLFSVRDEGIGIDPRYKSRIFSVFKRLNNDVPGVGSGLALADGIIQRHQGKIWVESQPGEGATFFVWLPKPADLAPEPTVDPSASRKKEL